jgi:hypothetical protein
MAVRDIYERLRPPEPTPTDELCSCAAGTPVKLMSTGGIGFNPIHCLDCNREVAPERLGLSAKLAEAVATWHWTYGAIDALELASGEYEQWARDQLLDPASPPNVEGRVVVERLNELNRCYFWFFEPEADDDWRPRSTCPICDEPLTRYEGGFFPQLLCERDKVVVVGR